MTTKSGGTALRKSVLDDTAPHWSSEQRPKLGQRASFGEIYMLLIDIFETLPSNSRISFQG